VSYTEEDERRAHIENMEADTRYKNTQAYWEPYKLIIAGAVALAALIGVAAGLAGYKLGSQPPATIVVNVPSPTK
jgi:hypothetical protein